jgi:hypothetical protein
MRLKFWTSVFILCLLGTTLSPVLQGQVVKPNPAKIQELQTTLNQIKSAYDQLPKNHVALLDGPSHAVQFAKVFPQLAPRMSKSMSRGEFKKAIAEADTNVATVSDPSHDLDFSAYALYTQSETSTARCGNQVVVGFNDSGSEFETSFFNGGTSFSGGAVSSDGGRTFNDIGFINPGSNFTNFLLGDPVLNCTDSSTFYFTQLMTFRDSSNIPQSAVVISKSTDGGNTWGDPVVAIAKFVQKPVGGFILLGHFLDKNWAAIDPSHPSRIYISYTDFDNSGQSPGCGNVVRTAIEVVVSNDGGQTFGPPTIVDEQCGDNVGVQASHVAVNSHGVAYLAWERFTPTAIEMRATHLNPNGSAAPAVLVDQKVLGGDTFEICGGLSCSLETDLQGEFRDLVGLDLAVDRSGGPNDGTVYVTWDDGRNKSVPDLLGFDAGLGIPPDTGQLLVPGFSPLILTAGNYAYTDVLVSASRDGVHFGASIKVNSDRQPKVGGGHDHFQPAIATDPRGTVAVCWYDRRNDPRNLQIERFCAESKNGKQWNNFRVPISPFAPVHRLDFGIAINYMGDYDGLTSDFSGSTLGFIGAFEWMGSGMNPDVKAFKFE